MNNKEHRGSLDVFVDSLEKRARTARTISIAITIGTVALGAFILFSTIRTVRKQIANEKYNLWSVQKDLGEAQLRLDDLRTAYANERKAFELLPEKEREALLKKAAENSQTDPASPRVYLQILDNNQRAQANAVSNMLKRKGFNVQGVEWVRVPVTLKQTQVKYFKPEFADEAKNLALLLGQLDISASATPVNLSSAVGQIEIWFSFDAFATFINRKFEGSWQGKLTDPGGGDPVDFLLIFSRDGDRLAGWSEEPTERAPITGVVVSPSGNITFSIESKDGRAQCSGDLTADYSSIKGECKNSEIVFTVKRVPKS